MDVTLDGVSEWLDRSDGRLGDIFGLWVQGKRDNAWVAERLVDEGHIAALVPAAERAYTLLISATPALLRAWRDAPNDTARRLNALLHDEAVQWCRAYQAATGRGDQGLRRTDEPA